MEALRRQTAAVYGAREYDPTLLFRCLYVAYPLVQIRRLVCSRADGEQFSKTALAGSKSGLGLKKIWRFRSYVAAPETGTGRAPAGTTKSFPTALICNQRVSNA